jgi:hypothetical protein
MKTYKELLSELKGRKPKGDVVFDKKVKKLPVLITKEKGSLPFVVYIDGDRLDAFKSQKDAEKSAMQVVKELT